MNVLKTLIVVFNLLVISLPSSAVAESNPFSKMKKSAKKIQQEIIFDNCVIAKSKGQLKVVQVPIRRSCKAISENPSWFQKLKWGG